MATENLGIAEVTQSQAQKVVTINEAFNDLDNATQSKDVITLSGDKTLSMLEFTRNFVLSFTGSLGSPATVTVPDTSRFFAVRNTTGQELTVANSTVSFMVADTGQALVHLDSVAATTLGGVTSGGSGVAWDDISGVPVALITDFLAGIENATIGQVFVANGSAGGSWETRIVIQEISQADYDALSPPDSNILYAVTS